MKKRIFSVLLTLALVIGVLPMGAMAAEPPATVTVSFYSNGYELPKQTVTVSADLSDTYGYTDSVTDGISVLDALIAAHQLYYKAQMDGADDALEYFRDWLISGGLTLSGTGVTDAFGSVDGSGNFGFSVNGAQPVDKSQTFPASSYGPESYLSLSVGQASISAGDDIAFYRYQDTSFWADYFTWFENEDGKVNELTAAPNEEISLTLKGYAYMSYGAAVDASYRENDNSFDPTDLPVILLDAATGQVTDKNFGTVKDNGTFTVYFSNPGTYVLSVSPDEYTNLFAPWCIITVAPLPDTTITVPSDATLFVGQKDYTGYNYRQFTALNAALEQENPDGTTTYYYDIEANKYCAYRVSGADYVTTVGYFTKKAEQNVVVTEETLKPAGMTKTTLDRDVTASSGNNVANLLMNVGAQGYLSLNAGETYQLVNLRSWQMLPTTTTGQNSFFIQPDYHYTVLNENGQPGDAVVVDENGKLTAKTAGTAIVLVTYDAVYNTADGISKGFQSAIWPENTGVLVVSVGAGESGIDANMTVPSTYTNTVSTGQWGDNNPSRISGYALDAELDVVYFAGNEGSYTFTPATAGCAVSVANPSVSETALTFTGFRAVSARADGSFTVPLKEGRNIIKVSKDGKSTYQVVTAKQISYTVNNGAAVKPGDEVTIVFDKIYHPTGQLGGIYNHTAKLEYTTSEGQKVNSVKGANSSFASTANAQTLKITIPADWTGNQYALTAGSIYASGFGDPFGGHRGVTLETGKDVNFKASQRSANMGFLPDIEIPIVVTEAALSGIEVTAPPAKTAYYAGEPFDPAGMAVTATYADGKTQAITNYTVSPEVLEEGATQVTVTYQGKTATVAVTVSPLALDSIAVTTPPTKTAYQVGDVFDPTGMVVTATYNSGKTEAISDYTYAPARELTETDTEITVSCGDKAAATPITVRPASQGGDTPSTITVQFKLLGDSAHGEGGGIHTLKANNLTTWVEQTSITVPQNSTVIDAITKALGLNGIPYENPDGSYITSVRGLKEFDNGQHSGWMYMLNNKYPELGIAEQTLKAGDVIVFHYTDDYTAERASEGFGGGSGSAAEQPGASVPELTPSAAVNQSGEAKANVSANDLSTAVQQAKAGDANEIVITPVVKGDASKVTVEAPKSALDSMANNSGLGLMVKTSMGNVTLPADSLDGLAKQSGGSVTVSTEEKANGAVGVTVAIDGTPVETLNGGLLAAIPSAKPASGNVLAVLNKDGSETLVKKSVVDGANVKGLLDGSCTVKVVDNSKHFTDTETHWAASGIAFASSRELFTGVGGNRFAPNTSMSRAMLATVLYRLEDADNSGEADFTDVPDGAWYADAVAWANEEGIVTGYSGRRFAPDEAVTREQLAAMLYRYAKTAGMNVTATDSLNGFTDSGKVSAYAADAMRWAVGCGLVNGKGGNTLDPSGTATRAEVATMMERMVKLALQ